MGKGDTGTRKGKIFAGSFGKRRPHKHGRRNKGPAGPARRAGSPKSMPPQSKE